jgi:hypothetical protein
MKACLCRKRKGPGGPFLLEEHYARSDAGTYNNQWKYSKLNQVRNLDEVHKLDKVRKLEEVRELEGELVGVLDDVCELREVRDVHFQHKSLALAAASFQA